MFLVLIQLNIFTLLHISGDIIFYIISLLVYVSELFCIHMFSQGAKHCDHIVLLAVLYAEILSEFGRLR